MYIAKNQSWWKVLCKKTRAVGYKVIELAKFTEDMKKEFYLVGESLLGNNAKKMQCAERSEWAVPHQVAVEKITFSNFSCMFLNPNIFFQFEF